MNIVFLVNIKGVRHKPEFDLSIESWRRWCKKNGHLLYVLTEKIHDEDYMKPNWHKYYLFQLLENDKIDYDKVLIVDADTIVHPNCPNFFDEVEEDEFGVVLSDGDNEWVGRSVTAYKDFTFQDVEKVPIWEYFNTGFMLFSKHHKKFFEDVLKWYHENAELIYRAQTEIALSTEQTPLNYLVKKWNIKMKYLPLKYNLQDPFRKNLLYIPNYSYWEDSLEFMYDSGWIYHFNAIPPNDRNAGYWIERTFNELWGKE